MIKATVFRYDPTKDKKPHFETYEVPFIERMSILSALDYIYRNIDNTLAYRVACLIDRCGVCDAIVNGKGVQTCKEFVVGDFTIEPPVQHGYRIIKDLAFEFPTDGEIHSAARISAHGMVDTAIRAHKERGGS